MVQNEALSTAFVALNETLRERAVKAGATYVDSWEAFADEAGKYSGTGPDVNGQVAKLRTADGIDFTRAGERKLASFVEPDLRQDREKDRARKPDPLAVAIPEPPSLDALTNDVNAQIRREAGLPALPSLEPNRATVGPVIAITAPSLSPGGLLADGRSGAAGPGSSNSTGDALVRRSLVEGQPIPPRPGRMDDFSWPRP